MPTGLPAATTTASSIVDSRRTGRSPPARPRRSGRAGRSPACRRTRSCVRPPAPAGRWSATPVPVRTPGPGTAWTPPRDRPRRSRPRSPPTPGASSPGTPAPGTTRPWMTDTVVDTSEVSSMSTRHAVVGTVVGDVSIVAEGEAGRRPVLPAALDEPRPGDCSVRRWTPTTTPCWRPGRTARSTEYLAGGAAYVVRRADRRRRRELRSSSGCGRSSPRSRTARRRRTARSPRPLGDRNLARMVGRAVGRNPLSVVVPCHRVVGKDGRLTGYAGGLEREQVPQHKIHARRVRDADAVVQHRARPAVAAAAAAAPGHRCSRSARTTSRRCSRWT